MVTTVLFGCAPYINTYYLPKAQEGGRSSHTTITSDAPTWILQKGGATFSFSATKSNNNKPRLSLIIKPLHLASETSLSAKVREEAKAAVKPIIVGLANFKNGVSIINGGATDKSEPIRIVKGTYGTNDRHNIESINNDLYLVVDQYLAISAAYIKTDVNSYIVQWPPININHKEIMLPPIEFKWKHGVQVIFING